MTETLPPDEAALPPQPPPLARAVALQLVTRYRLRLVDRRDGRMGELSPDYELAAAAWTGDRAALVGFYTPPPDPAAALADLHRRIGAALRWGDERLRIQPAQRCDILIVAMAPVEAQLPPPQHPAVSVGVIWVDPHSGAGDSLLPPPPGMPGLREIRAIAATLRDGAEAPTLAAVDLAERQTVAGGYVAPTRRALLTTPAVTYGLVAAFVLIFLVENQMISTYGNVGFLGAGALAFGQTPQLGYSSTGGSDWWRFVSTAFLHVPGGFGGVSFLSLHLIVNSFSAVNLGRIVEPLYGRLMLLGTFLTTAVAGNLVSVAAAEVHLPRASFAGVGASGGLCGLLGLLFVLGRVQGKNVPAGLARGLRQSVIVSALLTVFIGFSIPNINNYAHLGGFAAGGLIGLALPPTPAVGGRELRSWERAALTAVIAAGAVALVFAAVNIIQFFSNPPPPPLFPGG